jgi:20S proteasome alpha/beta subunit
MTTKSFLRCRCSFLVLVLACLARFDLSSASSNNYNVYNYDTTTPQFTPDGRLLQVEYACSAAELSNPVVALQFQNDTLVVVALRTSNTQSRIVPLDNNICIAMSGVLADSVALLQVVLKRSSQQLQRYKKSLTLFQVAAAIADACQRHAFGGGIRPYGSTMLVCGFVGEKAVLYQTDPSGGIQEAPVASANAMRQIRWIVGGNSAAQRQLRKRLASNLSRQRKQEEASIVDSIAVVARTLIKETQQNAKEQPSVEVVVLSSTLGAHRLDKDQLDAVLKRM